MTPDKQTICYTCPRCKTDNEDVTDNENVSGKVFTCKHCGAKVRMRNRAYGVKIQ
jgi:DNA-directed RNA polymerase subunit RPC12/RpoP